MAWECEEGGNKGEEGHMLRRILDALITGKRWRGSQKTRWKDSCNRDMKVPVKDGEGGREKSKNILMTLDDEKRQRKKKVYILQL